MNTTYRGYTSSRGTKNKSDLVRDIYKTATKKGISHADKVAEIRTLYDSNRRGLSQQDKQGIANLVDNHYQYVQANRKNIKGSRSVLSKLSALQTDISGSSTSASTTRHSRSSRSSSRHSRPSSGSSFGSYFGSVGRYFSRISTEIKANSGKIKAGLAVALMPLAILGAVATAGGYLGKPPAKYTPAPAQYQTLAQRAQAAPIAVPGANLENKVESTALPKDGFIDSTKKVLDETKAYMESTSKKQNKVKKDSPRDKIFKNSGKKTDALLLKKENDLIKGKNQPQTYVPNANTNVNLPSIPSAQYSTPSRYSPTARLIPGDVPFNPIKPQPTRHSESKQSISSQPPVIDAYEQKKLDDAKLAKAKDRALEQSHSIYLAGRARAIDAAGIPNLGSDDALDYIPKDLSIPVQPISVGNPTPKLGPFGIYGNYASSPGVGSTNTDTNVTLAAERFNSAGKKFADVPLACAFAKDKPPIGWDHAGKSTLKHLKNWGESIVDPLKPNSLNYNGPAVPQRAINFLGAIPAGALRLPTDTLALIFGNTSRRVVDRFFEAGNDVVEGLINVPSAYGNLIPDEDGRKASAGFWRFVGNVGKGDGLENTLDPQKRILKGPIGYAETFLNILGTAFGIERGFGNGGENFATSSPTTSSSISGTRIPRIPVR